MKKKILVLLTAMSLASFAAGCGSKDSSSDNTTQAAVETTAQAVADNAASGDDAKAESGNVTVTRGTIENGTFTNSTFGISFPITDDMKAMTDEEIANTLGMSQSLLESNNISAEDFEKAMNGVIYDAMITIGADGTNVNISYINKTTTGAANVTIDQYADVMKQQFEAMTNPKYTVNDISDVTLGGSTYKCIDAATDSGFNQKILAKDENGYVVQIVLTYTEASKDKMEAFQNSIK